MLTTATAVSAAVLFIDVLVPVKGVFSTKYAVPPLSQSLVNYKAHKPAATLDNVFSMVVWNAHKGTDGQAWANEVTHISQAQDIIMLQEATDELLFTDLFKNDLNRFSWSFAKSFTYIKTGVSAGVATGALAKATSLKLHRTTDVEPIVATPKTTLISYYTLANSRKIAFLNIHALNATSNQAFYKQIDESLKMLSNFKGPIVYAGDFNTNTFVNGTEKLNTLVRQMAAHGLKLVKFPSDPRVLQLDWIFVRGCTPVSAEILSQYQTSDHYPITAQIDCNL